MYRFSATIALWCVIHVNILVANPVFATRMLREMAEKMQLAHLAELKPDTDDRSSYAWKGHTLRVCTNQWEEIDHIGYELFDSLTFKASSSKVVCRFLERYLLDCSLPNQWDSYTRMKLDEFFFERGDAETLLGLENYSKVDIQSHDLRTYEVHWSVGDEVVVAVVFPMDNQLLQGCNLIELEEKYLLDIERYQPSTPVVLNLPQGDDRVVSNGSFLNDAIRSQLFFQMKDGKPQLVCSDKEWRKSLYNLLLSGQCLGNYTMHLLMDRYGYQVKEHLMPLCHWQSYCMEEGCELYMGIKELRNDTVYASVFAVNRMCGYMHLLSVKVEKNCFDRKAGEVHGRLYTYIPLHNVSAEMFGREYEFF